MISSRQGYTALRDVISDKALGMFRKERITRAEFWALKDIEFSLYAGDTLGIIGTNGAGKSTLLKLISRITEPTTGRIEINGRVASLLEVGTGFHPELTGRENIFLNGAILGMSRAEVKNKFSEIVEFSGIAPFLDTPIKRYSSGMYLRLAFAVAAHLEPELLMVDEVLAVGDAEFQKKCIGKMDEVSKTRGRTILFVSHNMDALSKFCKKGILLEKGRIKASGEIRTVIDQYTSEFNLVCERKDWEAEHAPGDSQVRLLSAWLHDNEFKPRAQFEVTEKVGLSFIYEVLQDNCLFTHGLNVFNSQGVNIFNSHDVVSSLKDVRRKKGMYQATAWIPEDLLPEDNFTIGVALFSPQPFYIHVHEADVLAFRAFDSLQGLSARGDYMGTEFGGVVRPLLQWEAHSI